MKILILGSDYGTLDIVRCAKEKGLHVITADLMSSSPTKAESDESWLISTTDIDGLARLCLENEVGAILAGASDFNLSNCRKLGERLGLPVYCQDSLAWDVATNKRAFKELCKQVGAPIARDYCEADVVASHYKAVAFPVVVKAVDLSGNRGMSYCSTPEELEIACERARNCSKSGDIIIERQLRGPEFAVNYVMAHGDIRLLFFSSEHHQPGKAANLYSVIVTTSRHLRQYLDEVNDKVIEVFRAAGCRDGVAWVEAMLDEDGHFYLLEMGYRFGGEMVNIPYRFVSHFDSVGHMLDIACGADPCSLFLPDSLLWCERSVAATYMLFAKKDGVIHSISGLEAIQKIPNIELDLPKREGSAVRENATMGIAHIFGRDVNAVCEAIAYINETLVMADDTGNNLFVRFTDYPALRREYEEGLLEFGFSL